MCIGSLLAAWAGRASSTDHARLNAAGDEFFDGFGGIVLVFSALGLISVTALNMYGGSLTLISALDSLQEGAADPGGPAVDDRRSPPRSRWSSRLLIGDELPGQLQNFLLLVLYFFIPWTAVNLVDYFIVRRGHYAIAEIFKPDGIYGRWGWRGHRLLPGRLRGDGAVLLHRALLRAGSPRRSHGADFSLFIGLPVAGEPLLVALPIDRRRGRGRLAEEQADILEREAFRSVLERYRSTYSTLNANDAKAVWPGVDAEDAVKGLQSTAVTGPAVHGAARLRTQRQSRQRHLRRACGVGAQGRLPERTAMPSPSVELQPAA